LAGRQSAPPVQAAEARPMHAALMCLAHFSAIEMVGIEACGTGHHWARETISLPWS